jgi:glycerate 2-kinase
MNFRKANLEVFRAGLTAVLPENLIREAVTVTDMGLMIEEKSFPFSNTSRIHIFGSGKASIGAANAFEEILPERIAGGLIVSNYADSSPKKIDILESSHPVPDERSLRAADLLIDRLSELSEHDFFIYLLSGGSSALIERPVFPLCLKELQEVSMLLMNCGATIYELNAVRKHLSAIKGGRLAKMTKAKGVVLVISDVIGDDLEVIGSAPFYMDSSTFADVWALFTKYKLLYKLPPAVVAHIEKGLAGEIEETPKMAPPHIAHIVIGSNRKALLRAKEKAESLDMTAHILTSSLRGEAKEIAKAIVAMGEEIVVTMKKSNIPVCLIFGGETTVTVTGDGKGGRNQEMCLSALKEIGNRKEMIFLSAGTDGVDGNSSAAGAVVDSLSYKRAEELGLKIDDYLKRNDSNSLLAMTGDLITTGPTGINVMDITILMIGGNNR